MICRSGRRTRKYTSNWFPSFDDVNEKVIFNIACFNNQEYQAISNGMLADKTTKGNMFLYHMQNP
jgi:aminopeptidase N